MASSSLPLPPDPWNRPVAHPTFNLCLLGFTAHSDYLSIYADMRQPTIGKMLKVTDSGGLGRLVEVAGWFSGTLDPPHLCRKLQSEVWPHLASCICFCLAPFSIATTCALCAHGKLERAPFQS